MFINRKTMINKNMERGIKVLGIDIRLKFVEKEFLMFFTEEGITRHHTCVGRPQQNGVAERTNKTLLERARCILSQAKLTKEFWAEAVSTTRYFINRSPHTTFDFKCAQEVFFPNRLLKSKYFWM